MESVLSQHQLLVLEAALMILSGVINFKFVFARMASQISTAYASHADQSKIQMEVQDPIKSLANANLDITGTPPHPHAHHHDLSKIYFITIYHH